MNTDRYSLEPYRGKSTRHTCPQCNKKNQFTLYIDNETGEPLHENVGRCNYESCYHYPPKQFFLDNPDREERSAAPIRQTINPPPPPKPVDYIDNRFFTPTLSSNHYNINTFLIWLSSVFGIDKAHQVASDYRVGTTKSGECIFWQIDRQKRIRTGKIRRYDKATGKSLSTDWTHSRIGKLTGKPLNYQQIYFGSHLLELPENEGKTVAIVEGEKTAVFMAIVMPQYIWVSTGGGANFGTDCKVNFSHLKDFTAIVFPDTGKFESWQGKAERARFAGFKIAVNDFLENKYRAGEVGNNADLIDYYLPLTLAENSTQKYTPKKGHQEQEKVTDVTPKKGHQEQENATKKDTPKKENPTNPTPLKDDKASTKDDKTDKNETLSKLYEVFGEIEPPPPDWIETDFKPYLSDDRQKGHDDIGNGEISDLKAFFSSLTGCLPKIVLLNSGEVVTDLQKCIDTNLSYAENSEKQARIAYISKLKAIRREIELHQFADRV